jgi:acyl-coenzyme A synthetase/AMP-(fatty) acid ligase
VPIPVNFLARPDDFGCFLDDSYAVVAILDRAFLESVGPQLETRPQIRRIVSDDLNLGGECEIDPVDTHPDDPAFWMYGSGSTDLPKAVVHRHSSVEAIYRRYVWPTLTLTEDDVVFSSTKMFHAYGFGNNLTFPLSVGATSVYLVGRPTPTALLERVATHRPNIFFSVPALYNAILALPEFDQTDWTSVRFGVSAAEPLAPEIWRRFHDRTGIEILCFYVIANAADLTAADRERLAQRDGNEHVESPVPYDMLKEEAGFVDIELTDVTSHYATTLRA